MIMRNEIIVSRRYKEKVLKKFHRYYLEYGEHLCVDIKGLDSIFSGHDPQKLSPALDILREEGLIDFDISGPEIDRVKLTRKGIGYFASRQEADREKRIGIIWDFAKLALAAFLGALAAKLIS